MPWPVTVFRMLAPHGEHIITAALRAALAPQHEERHSRLLGAVVDKIDRGPGTVLVAGRPGRLGVLEAAQILGERFRLQLRRIAQQRAQLVAQKEFRLRADQPFRKSSRPDQKRTGANSRSPPSGRSSRNGRGSARCQAVPYARCAQDGRAPIGGRPAPRGRARRRRSARSRALASFRLGRGPTHASNVLSGPADGLELSP
jgi:hypothetical protein